MSQSRISTVHNPSPYLRRYRMPQLNTLRIHEDPCSPEDEDGKMMLIREKMEQLTREAIERKKRVVEKETNKERMIPQHSREERKEEKRRPIVVQLESRQHSFPSHIQHNFSMESRPNCLEMASSTTSNMNKKEEITARSNGFSRWKNGKI